VVGGREGTNRLRGPNDRRTLKEDASVPRNKSQIGALDATCGRPFHLPSRSSRSDDAPACQRACGNGFPCVSGGRSARGRDIMIEWALAYRANHSGRSEQNQFHPTTYQSHECAYPSECGDHRLQERHWVSVHSCLNLLGEQQVGPVVASPRRCPSRKTTTCLRVRFGSP